MIHCSTDSYQQALPTALSLGHQCLASCGWKHGPGALSSSQVVLVMPSVQSQWFLLIQTLILQPSHSNLPSSETKWNGCRCDSRVHHIICWIQTLTLNLSLLIVTPGDPRFHELSILVLSLPNPFIILAHQCLLDLTKSWSLHQFQKLHVFSPYFDHLHPLNLLMIQIYLFFLTWPMILTHTSASVPLFSPCLILILTLTQVMEAIYNLL